MKKVLLIFASFWFLLGNGIKLIPSPWGIYHSAFPNFGGPEDMVSCERIRKFESLAGKKIVWAFFSNNWINGIKFPATHIREISRCGALPFVRLMARSSFNFGPDPQYTLQAIIDGKFDGALRQWARDAKKYGGPILAEFGVEMNGDWFPWSGYWNGGGQTTGYGDPSYPDGPERFRDAYRHIIEIFREEGALNITWFFHVNWISFPDEEWNKFKYYYPGDSYIDWVGTSVYGALFPDERDMWDELGFREGFLKFYKQIEEFAPSKPIAVEEFGVIQDPRKPQWIRDAFEFIKSFPKIKAISWWDEKWENEDGSFSDLRINSSAAALSEYKKQISNALFITVPLFNFYHSYRPK